MAKNNMMGDASPLTGPGNQPAWPVGITQLPGARLPDPAVIPGPFPENGGLTASTAGIPGAALQQGMVGGPNIMDQMGLNQPRPMMPGMTGNGR